MSSNKAKWSDDGNDLPNIEPHTQAKHQIIQEYITNLIRTLYGTGKYGVTKFTFIDGFSGGGMYRHGDSLWEGSPLRMIKAVREGYRQAKRAYPLDVQFIFIDEKHKHLNCLQDYAMAQAGLEELTDEKEHKLPGEKGCLSERCEFLQGKFEGLVDYCINVAKERKGHVFFLLDPFGLKDFSMASIRKINSLGKVEILLTFMIDWISRFVKEKDGKQESIFKYGLEADGYYNLDELDGFGLDIINRIGKQCYLRNESMRLFRNRGNAERVITFSMIGKKFKNRALYYLIHMSKNHRALEVMKESFWQINNLESQYYFEVHGYGFNTVNFYEENQMALKFDITQDNDEYCLEKLDEQLRHLIDKDGITYKQIRGKTMELNPASVEHYEQYIKRLRESSEILVVRNGKITQAQNLYNNDIIKLPDYKQLRLF